MQPETFRIKAVQGEPPPSFVWGRFQVGLAQTPAEVEEAQRLRHMVFKREWLGLDDSVPGLDRDEYDEFCDHLLVRDKDSGLLIGTYRFNHSQRSRKFFSSDEYELGSLLDWPDPKVEMGRACLRRDWRNNLAMIALARGIGWYADRTRTRWMFGCSSVLTTEVSTIALLIRWFQAGGHCLEVPGVQAKPDWELPGLAAALTAHPQVLPEHDPLINQYVPPILRFYFRAGAKLVPVPVLDRHLHCVDFLTILDWRLSNVDFCDRWER